MCRGSSTDSGSPAGPRSPSSPSATGWSPRATYLRPCPVHPSPGDPVDRPTATSVLRCINDFSRGRRISAPSLTSRQEEILQLVAYGLPNKRIARRLGIGVETVKTHISRIMEKLEAESRTEAVVRAVREGVLSPAMLGEDPDGASGTDHALDAG